jgi:hypothetical protein
MTSKTLQSKQKKGRCTKVIGPSLGRKLFLDDNANRTFPKPNRYIRG